jgi:hypothetical protein
MYVHEGRLRVMEFNATFNNISVISWREHSRINILQWILTRLGTYLVLRRVWNPIDFQGHRSKVKVKFGQNSLKDLDSRVFTRMLCGKNLTR